MAECSANTPACQIPPPRSEETASQKLIILCGQSSAKVNPFHGRVQRRYPRLPATRIQPLYGVCVVGLSVSGVVCGVYGVGCRV